MKIAMIGARGIPDVNGGVETSLQEICPRLVARGHKVTVYSRNYYSDMPDVYKGVEIKKIACLNTKHLDTFSHVFFSTADSLRGNFDIVHFNALGPSMFSFLPRLCGTKTVSTVQGLDWQRAKWGMFARLVLRFGEYSSSKFPNKTIVVSRTLKEYYDCKYKNGTVYIPNGTIIPEDIKGPDLIKKFGLSKANYILFLARLVPEKGCHYLIKAFNEIKTNLKLVIAGGSSYTDKYVNDLKNISENKNIIFTGIVKGELKAELLRNAYFYVLPSEIEGLPISLLEAMSYKRCVLASNIAENLEVIKGISISFKNKDRQDLKKQIETLILNRDMVKRFGQAGFEHVKTNYSWDKITDEIEKIYFELLDKSTVDRTYNYEKQKLGTD